MKFKLAISILLSIFLISDTSYAATPTPKPSVTAKPSPTPAATKSTSTAQSSPSSTSTKKPTKKPVKKKRVKKTATPIPSPLPVWPPVGFTANNGIYAKIPSGKELLGLISAKIGLATDVKKCESNACGAVIVAADYLCKWWEIKSTVSGVDPNDLNKKILLGSLRTTYGELGPKTYANILLISDEPLFMPTTTDPNTGQAAAPVAKNGIVVGNIQAICHKSATEEKIPTNIYTPTK
ncbi:MAG: hypothetical protein F2944_01330 [Actinobacteria bacterium]|uniref:Unannotated protein n=1 Tax=freshwater metagenome TaxID=449393 RepID=A0A6J7U543_9ZZZZ|nr:hypothetical protein [Actinomycetota bacterium]